MREWELCRSCELAAALSALQHVLHRPEIAKKVNIENYFLMLALAFNNIRKSCHNEHSILRLPHKTQKCVVIDGCRAAARLMCDTGFTSKHLTYSSIGSAVAQW